MADTSLWEKNFLEYSEEISFFRTLLTSDVFENKMPNLYEKLQEYFNRISELKDEKTELQEAVRNHRNDLNGMMECEDISCESFYHSQHHNLMKRLEKNHSKFRDLKMHLLRFATPLLKKVV